MKGQPRIAFLRQFSGRDASEGEENDGGDPEKHQGGKTGHNHDRDTSLNHNEYSDQDEQEDDEAGGWTAAIFFPSRNKSIPAQGLDQTTNCRQGLGEPDPAETAPTRQDKKLQTSPFRREPRKPVLV